MAHDLESLDILTDDDPRESLEWWLTVVDAAVVTVVLTAWWAPRTWWTALTRNPGHGLAVARRPLRRRA